MQGLTVVRLDAGAHITARARNSGRTDNLIACWTNIDPKSVRIVGHSIADLGQYAI